MDWLMIAVGLMWAIVSLATFIWPKYGIQNSDQRQSRLREIDAGADEAFFEEKRELESYSGRFPSAKFARVVAIIMLPLSLIMIWSGLSV
ncbi:hypothetical protein QWY75_01730 [Pontixanthobacter aestiaquae]|uniref:Uncharacterized protein n=1 Tax=Pontixanthobacter aestiaquae TaxID=1509367 RepID=A0A844Z8D5_9SPHN|nr:hypothetical protein [Pontixanthobacter aestiaquae]MDN3644921.1 hypothetical protein [Pontixanthobacter aestiaquae]MXO84078.1 hypothetical protein [Pontixanthobacter aestiaquae]